MTPGPRNASAPETRPASATQDDQDRILEGKVAIVTGASRGIGAGGRAPAVITDVGDPASVERLVQDTLTVHGRLDIAFNNAGQGHQPAPLGELSGGGVIVNIASTAGLGAFRASAATPPLSMRSSASLLQPRWTTPGRAFVSTRSGRGRSPATAWPRWMHRRTSGSPARSAP